MLRLPCFALQIWTIQVSNCISRTCICLIFIKGPILCSSGSSLTKSLSSHIKSLMLWCSTSFAYQILIKQNPEETVINYQCSGTKVCLFSLRGKSLIHDHQGILLNARYLFRYASDLTPDQKDALLDVIRVTPHPEIGPEIRRELVNSVIRGAPRTQPDGDIMMA